ncbi:MAG: hypothetical protein U9P80_08880 [Thermodesulfobacteriota bacterium]|nr:hypothetical protein [Thermodesulfobacteriota bacterium]
MDLPGIFFYGQIIILVILTGVVVLMIIKDRGKKRLLGKLNGLDEIIDRTQSLSDGLAEQIKERSDIVSRLTGDLDRRIARAEVLLNDLESDMDSMDRHAAAATRAFSKNDVMRLIDKGHDPHEIARMTGIPIGEIQLMIRVHEDSGQ